MADSNTSSPAGYIADGQGYPDEVSAVVDQHPNIPPELKRVYITKPDEPKPEDTSNIEDRRDDSFFDTLKSFIGSQFTMDKFNAIMAHPLMSTSDRANWQNEQMNPPDMNSETNPMGADLGLQSIPDTPSPTPFMTPEKLASVYDPESIDKALGIAMGFSGGGLTFGGSKAIGSILNSVEHDGSALFNEALEKGKGLTQALDMENIGHNLDDIWEQTGWFKGADNRWRFEIPDTNSKINENHLIPTTYIGQPATDLYGNLKYEIPKGGSVSLGDLFDHPRLYKYYPKLKNIKVQPLSGFDRMSGTLGSMDSARGIMKLAPSSLNQMKSIILHEAQHAIQRSEGFSTGAAASWFESPRWKDMMSEFRDFKIGVENKIRASGLSAMDLKDAVSNEARLPELEERARQPWSSYTRSEVTKMKEDLDSAKRLNVYNDLKKIIQGERIKDAHYELAFKHYERVKGEVEARNVQSRIHGQERSTVPTRTESVARDEQIWSPGDPASLRDLAE